MQRPADPLRWARSVVRLRKNDRSGRRRQEAAPLPAEVLAPVPAAPVVVVVGARLGRGRSDRSRDGGPPPAAEPQAARRTRRPSRPTEGLWPLTRHGAHRAASATRSSPEAVVGLAHRRVHRAARAVDGEGHLLAGRCWCGPIAASSEAADLDVAGPALARHVEEGGPDRPASGGRPAAPCRETLTRPATPERWSSTTRCSQSL